MVLSELLNEATLDGGYDDSGNMLLAETLAEFRGVPLDLPRIGAPYSFP